MDVKLTDLETILNAPRPRKAGCEKAANESYYGAKNKLTAADVREWESSAAGIDTMVATNGR